MNTSTDLLLACADLLFSLTGDLMADSVLGTLDGLTFCEVEKSGSSPLSSGITFSSLTLAGGGRAELLYS